MRMSWPLKRDKKFEKILFDKTLESTCEWVFKVEPTKLWSRTRGGFYPLGSPLVTPHPTPHMWESGCIQISWMWLGNKLLERYLMCALNHKIENKKHLQLCHLDWFKIQRKIILAHLGVIENHVFFSCNDQLVGFSPRKYLKYVNILTLPLGKKIKVVIIKSLYPSRWPKRVGGQGGSLW
jgi:hypothetical protein